MKHHVYGAYDEEAAGQPQEFYRVREVTLDFRGTLRIDPTSDWGSQILVTTLSHDPADWDKTVDRPVIVEAGAKIMSRAILYNCRIGRMAMVSIGSVVRSVDVPPFAVVSGNPAQIIGWASDGGVFYLGSPVPLERRGRRTP